MGRRDRGLEGERCPEPGCSPPPWDLVPAEWSPCPSGSAPAQPGTSPLTQGQQVVAGAGSRHVLRPVGLDGAGIPCAGASQDPCASGLARSLRAGGFHIAPARGMNLLGLSPRTPCMYGVQGAGEPAPQTTAVQWRPRETSRRKEPPGLRPPQEPPCRAHSRWPQVPPQRERRRALGPGTRGGCVPAAPAAFQEQYCWHQAGSLRRQRIHRPFMRGAGMIYCLGEGAGAGGWSPGVLAPAPSPSCVLAAAGPRAREAEGLAGGTPLLGQAWGRAGPRAPSPHYPPCLRGPGDALPPRAPRCI